MADNKNMELNDEMMANATGGEGEEIPAPRFKVGDIAVQISGEYRLTILEVLRYGGPEWGWNYRVKYMQGGAETDFIYDKDLA